MPRYTFTQTEQTQIIDAFDDGSIVNWQSGDQIQFYTTVTNVLKTDNGSGSPDQDPVVLPVRIWFEGATKVNSGDGAFSTLIREYTQAQGELHWDRRFTDSDNTAVVSEMQEASNRIARKAYSSLSTIHNWELQTIEQIATDDATAVGEVLFDFVPNDTINSDPLEGGQNAAWSGTLLFSSFDSPNNPNGVDETGRLISTQNPTKADTLDDWRNVLYAQSAYNTGLIEAGFESGSAIFDLEELTGLVDDGLVYYEICLLSGRCNPSLSVTVNNQVAEEAFQPALLYGGSDTLNLIKSAAEGVVNKTDLVVNLDHFPNVSFSTNFNKQAKLLFGPPGDQNQSISATFHSVDELIDEAQVGNGLAQKSLQGLSPFKVDNGITVNVVASNQYWADKGLMTKARLLFDAQNVEYGGSLTSSTFANPVQFNDMASGIELEVDNNIFPLSDFRQIKFGSQSADMISGGDHDDHLYGMDGNDSLNGGLGNDLLFGGSGSDNYVVDSGRDYIEDTDGSGSIFLNGETLLGGNRLGGQVWESANGRFKYQLNSSFLGSQLIVTDTTDNDGSIIITNFTSGNLGINLNDSSNPLPPIDTIAPADTAAIGTLDKYTTGSSGNDLYDAGNLYDNVSDFQGGDDVVLLGSDDGFSDRVSTAGGNDTIFGEEGNDYILAGVGYGDGENDKDTVSGGADVDLISTGVGDDYITAGMEGEDINATNTTDQGDWIVADEGNDTAYGTGNQDFITMGNGSDTVHAGGGFDVILADGHYLFNSAAAYISPVPYSGREHEWNGSSWDTTSINYAFLTPGSAFDFTTSIDGNGDFVFTPQASLFDSDRVQNEVAASNNDLVYAGPGSDWVSGGSGSDTLHGESGDDIIYGDDLVAMPVGTVYGNDIIYGGSGQDLLFGNQGNDEIYGGIDNDILYGDDTGEPTGDDNLYGGDGVDELYGFGGDDYLSGGSGDETILMGDAGNDVIDGDAGNDILTGGAGNDQLSGGEGDDTLNAGDDNDVLNGGVGNDILNGEAGNDTLFSSHGLNQLNGGDDNDAYIAILGNSPIDTPDIISDTGGTDRIIFDELVFANRVEFIDQGSDLLVKYSPSDALLVSGGAGGSVIEEYEFFDGRVLTYGDLNSATKVAKGSSNEITAFDDWYEGDASIQNLDMLAGNDAVLAYGGNDILTGNAGNDMLDGGADNDTLSGNAGNDRLFGASGDDLLNGGNDNDLLAAGDGADVLNGGNDIDVLRGGNGDDTLNGDAGDDFLQGDRGADTLQGGLGSDTYVFRYQDDPEPGITPKTTIVDTNDSGGNTVKFIGGLDADDITLINDIDTGELEIQYGHHEDTIISSIYVAGSAEGEVISEFEFSDGTSMSFEDLCLSQPATCEVDDLIFENGFEQTQTLKSDEYNFSDENYSNKQDVIDPFGSLAIVLSFWLQKLT